MATSMELQKEYKKRWGNYKSDKWKSGRILWAEITDILHVGDFSKRELIEIKNVLLKKMGE